MTRTRPRLVCVLPLAAANVGYSRGALLHRSEPIIPYGISDYATRFATVPLDEVLAAM